jgi:triosephosphate isomerase
MKKLIAGNWKMNGTLQGASALATAVLEKIGETPALRESVDFCICPPFLHLSAVKSRLADNGGVELGAQDCSVQSNGAYTGDVSAEMLADIGCRYVILGHSERRQYHGETDATVAAKAVKAHACGLITIICVGETERERESGLAEGVVGDQIRKSLPASSNADNTVIAYEPVWAIGTGKTPTSEDVKAMHHFIRGVLKEKLDNPDSIRILYGGSVKPENAAVLLNIENVNGALIGGASLKAEQFLAIAAASVA